MKRRYVLGCIIPLLILASIAPVHPAKAAGSVVVSAWSCLPGADPAATDAAAFAQACPAEEIGFVFELTAGGIERSRETKPDTPAKWTVVNGPFTLVLEAPANRPSVVFCDPGDGTSLRFEGPDGKIEATVTGDVEWSCDWYALAATASPAASPEPIATATSASTSTPVPTTQPSSTPTLIPTATASSTATSTPAPSATASSTSTPVPTTTPTSVPTATATLRPEPSPTTAPTVKPTSTMVPPATIAPTQPPTATTAATSTLVPTSTPVPSSTPAPTETPPPTATPTIEATPTPTATATTRPDPRATATAIASAISGIESDYFLEFHTLSYPRGEGIKVYPDPGGDDTGFDVEDFVIDVTFKNPGVDPGEPWDYGLLIGPTADGEYYRVYIRSDGTWHLDLGDESIREDDARGLQLETGDSNVFRLIVTGGRGILFLNDRYIASFDLSSREPAGKLWLSTTKIEGGDVAFSELSIWSFPPPD